MTVSRRMFLSGISPLVLGAANGRNDFQLEESSLAELRSALDAGKITALQLVTSYRERISAIDVNGPALRSVIELNPDALEIAAGLDQERQKRGLLHGIPILVKDNIDTADKMKTTAGSLALLSAPTPAADATVVQRLRQAGAVILGKTNLSEWANIRGRGSISGWSARGGFTKNPYATSRNPSGSSSGSAAAVAANLCAASIGTETDGSIVSPASVCGVVGFKPTVGVVSRFGIIPISHSQDTAGPMTRSVADCALVMDAIAGADSRDAATQKYPKPGIQFSSALARASLKGVRLGVVRRLVDVGWAVAPVAREALMVMERAGAKLVDVHLSSAAYEAAEFEVLMFELKAGLEAYLTRRGGPTKTLSDIVTFNTTHAKEELGYFGQQYLEEAATRAGLSSKEYRSALAACGTARLDLHGLLEKHRLEALVAPTGQAAWLTDTVNGDSYGFSFSTPAAVAGCPHLSVPMGFVGELPVAMSFVGPTWSDARILALGHAFETLGRARRPPRFLK